jgi:cytochrome c5
MRVFVKKYFCILFAASFVILSACSSAQEGKALFEAKCGACHDLEKSLKKTKSLAEWKKTSRVMVRYADGAIKEREAKIIAKYLAGRTNN